MMESITHTWLGEFDESERCATQACLLAERSGLAYDKIAADYSRGLWLASQGNLEEAESALDQASQLSRENEVRLFLPLVMSALGNIYLQRGRPAEAKDILLKAKTEGEELGHATSTLVASTYLATTYSQLGDTAHGLGVARACQAGARQKGYQGIEALATFTEASILASQNAPVAEAIDSMKRTVEITARLEARPLLGAARGTLARLLANSGRTAEAQDELVQAIALFDQSKMTVQLERAKATLSKFSEI
jgi:tetratricopeptide (TPR) repeat protein